MSEKSFPRVGFFSSGYDCQQVDDFFRKAREAYEGGMPADRFSSAQVRAAHFELVRHGYSPYAVDSALDRMEAAFVKRDRADHMAVNGASAWMEHVAQRATTLYPRMLRNRGERFVHPDGKGYSVEEVDNFLDYLADYFDSKVELTSDEIRSMVFKTARGKKAYDEAVVDAYLARATEVLLAVE